MAKNKYKHSAAHEQKNKKQRDALKKQNSLKTEKQKLVNTELPSVQPKKINEFFNNISSIFNNISFIKVANAQEESFTQTQEEKPSTKTKKENKFLNTISSIFNNKDKSIKSEKAKFPELTDSTKLVISALDCTASQVDKKDGTILVSASIEHLLKNREYSIGKKIFTLPDVDDRNKENLISIVEQLDNTYLNRPFDPTIIEAGTSSEQLENLLLTAYYGEKQSKPIPDIEYITADPKLCKYPKFARLINTYARNSDSFNIATCKKAKKVAKESPSIENNSATEKLIEITTVISAAESTVKKIVKKIDKDGNITTSTTSTPAKDLLKNADKSIAKKIHSLPDADYRNKERIFSLITEISNAHQRNIDPAIIESSTSCEELKNLLSTACYGQLYTNTKETQPNHKFIYEVSDPKLCKDPRTARAINQYAIDSEALGMATCKHVIPEKDVVENKVPIKNAKWITAKPGKTLKPEKKNIFKSKLRFNIPNAKFTKHATMALLAAFMLSLSQSANVQYPTQSPNLNKLTLRRDIFTAINLINDKNAPEFIKNECTHILNVFLSTGEQLEVSKDIGKYIIDNNYIIGRTGNPEDPRYDLEEDITFEEAVAVDGRIDKKDLDEDLVFSTGSTPVSAATLMDFIK